MASGTDLYALLGVGRDASRADIQRAYRRLARRYHPDVNDSADAAEKFKQISEAYAVLSDPKMRRKYDLFGDRCRQLPDDVEPWAWAAAGSRYGMGAAPGSGWFGVPFGAGDSLGWGDLFGDVFGAGRGFARARAPAAGPFAAGAAEDREIQVSVSVEEAYRGCTRTVPITGPGLRRDVAIVIPPGVVDGERIPSAAPRSLRIRIAPHPRYRLAGRDIAVDLPLAPWEAALGCTARVDTPAGPVKVTVPPGSSTGRRLRLKGRGLPGRGGAPGDLHAEVKIMVPPTLTATERALFSELAATSEFNARPHAPN